MFDNPEQYTVGDFWTYIDEKGRVSPCCEYFYEEDGFEKDSDTIDYLDKMFALSKENKENI